jgi:hypothetical protein
MACCFAQSAARSGDGSTKMASNMNQVVTASASELPFLERFVAPAHRPSQELLDSLGQPTLTKTPSPGSRPRIGPTAAQLTPGDASMTTRIPQQAALVARQLRIWKFVEFVACEKRKVFKFLSPAARRLIALRVSVAEPSENMFQHNQWQGEERCEPFFKVLRWPDCSVG